MQSDKQKLFLKRVNLHITFASYLASKLSKKYFSTKVGFSKADVKSEALLGLCIAAKSFSSEDEDMFKAYAAAIIANRVKRFVTNVSTPVSLKYSTCCDYKKAEVSVEKSKAAKMLKQATERNAYSEENFEQGSLVDDYYRKEFDSEQHVHSVIEYRKLRNALFNLPVESREILKSIYYDDVSPYTVAKSLNYSAVSVYQKRNKAFTELARVLEERPRVC